MSILDLARPELRAFKAYSSARLEAGSEGVLLNANEWPWPPFDGAGALHRYPPPQPPALLARLAQIYRWPAQGILAGRGSDEAIDLLVRGFCSAGQDSVLICPPTFGMYRVAAQLQGAAVISVPLCVENDFAIDVEAVLAAVDAKRPKLVFLCSPNNPTGQQADRAELLRLIDSLAGRALVIVDEAYVEFAHGPSLVCELDGRPHLAILRTLSKAYGLAAARIGCLLAAPELIGFLRGLMAPYPLPQPSVEAALQALDPTRDALRQRRLAVLLSERERLAAALRASPEIEQVWPSDANFLCFRCHNAADLLQRCAAAGLILRDVSHYPGLAGCLRVSIGVAEDVDRVIAVLSRLPTPISNSLPTLHIPPWSHTMPLKLLFVDRDGCLIEEPADEQIDSIAKFRLLPDVIAALKRFVDAGYELVMVTNQDGLGTASFPEADFEPPQRLLLDILATQGISFREILIDRHFPHEPNDTRKPKIGMALHYLREGLIDREHSLMVGDRETDLEFARNLGVAGYRVGPLGSSWPQIARTVLDRPRTASVRRNTRETQITVEVDLDREAEPRIDTGLGFFDHMLEQLGKHGGFALRLECQGDLQIDEHHTVEDCALALGSTLRKALGDKRGIGRYGFVVPMDETLAEVAIDLSGRPWFEFEGVFPRDRVGELPTELVPHFFRSLAETLGATLHLKVRGENAHHMVEGSFKAVARCLRQAFARQGDVLPSTKGTL